MQTLKTWKNHTIHGSSMFSGLLGFLAALCRAETWQLHRKSENRLVDNTLCYRGIRILTPLAKVESNRKVQNRQNDASLCYRGIRNSSLVSTLESHCESEIRYTDAALCYRGVRYSKPHVVASA